VGAVTPSNHLRWLPGTKREFPYRERTIQVARRGGNRVTLDDFGVLHHQLVIRPAERERFGRGDRAAWDGVPWRRVRMSVASG
jgi:hypothetical protein